MKSIDSKSDFSSSNVAMRDKLIVTIVRRSMTKKIIEAIKKAGATGSTIMYGIGIRKEEKSRVLGIPIKRERDIILTVAPAELTRKIMQTIYDTGKLNRPKTGICFTIDTNKVIGTHFTKTEKLNEGVKGMTKQTKQYDLIVTIVNKGDAETVIDATREAGADGGTIVTGRGTGVHETAKIFNIMIEPEKEIILTLVPRQITEQVLKAINANERLDQPGKGIAFVLSVDEVIGINHEINNKLRSELKKLNGD